VVSLPRYLLDDELHAFRGKELPLLYVYSLSRPSGGNQQFGLPAKESGDLQYIHVFGGSACLAGYVNIRKGKDAEALAHITEYLQPLRIPDTRKGVRTRTVGFTVRPFEYVRNGQLFRYFGYGFSYPESFFFLFYHAWTGHQEEILVVLKVCK
jgi:hypothetical protein